MKLENLKKIQIISIIVIIAIFVGNIKNSTKKTTIQTMSVPVTEKTIVLDAGHRRRRWWCSE